MIAKHFGVSCSQRCELVLALAAVLGRERLVPLAHRLANDSDLSAIRLARGLEELPREEAQILSRATLERAGVSLGGSSSAVSDRMRSIIQFCGVR